MRISRVLCLFALCLGVTESIDNGIGLSPPMGWRSWNQFQCAINQSLIEEHYEIMAAKTRENWLGTKMSFVELGYSAAGIDDCWQQCNSGPGNKGFHDAMGYPIVNKTAFPDMAAMTKKARDLGVLPGWYGNNCHCKDLECKDEACFAGDVKATLDYGFSSIKLDGCGAEKNVTLYAELFNKTGKHVMIENCHNGNPTYPTKKDDGTVDCPMNFFRSSTDIRPTFGSVLINLRSTIAFNGKNLTGPGCWAYPDMLEVGVTNTQRPPGVSPPLSFTEARSHFGAWAINSAPLVLGMDLRDAKQLDEVWPIISNTEAIMVNQAWAGESGVSVSMSADKTHFKDCSWFNTRGCDHPSTMVWSKKLPKSKHYPKGALAVLMMNNGDKPADVSANLFGHEATGGFTGCRSGSSGCAVRDVWNHKRLPSWEGGIWNGTSGFRDGVYEVKGLPSRDSHFVIISYCFSGYLC